MKPMPGIARIASHRFPLPGTVFTHGGEELALEVRVRVEREARPRERRRRRRRRRRQNRWLLLRQLRHLRRLRRRLLSIVCKLFMKSF